MAKEVVRDNRGYADTEQDLLCPSHVARKLRISVDTLKDWRIRGTGPKFIRLGYKLVRYRPADVERWLRQQTVKLNGTNGGDHA